MELHKKGDTFLPNQVVRGVFNGDVFGLLILMKVSGDGAGEGMKFPFSVKKWNSKKVEGIVDLGNGRLRHLSLSDPQAHTNLESVVFYEVSDLPEDDSWSRDVAKD